MLPGGDQEIANIVMHVSQRYMTGMEEAGNILTGEKVFRLPIDRSSLHHRVILPTTSEANVLRPRLPCWVLGVV